VQELAYEKAKEVFGRLSGEEGLLVIGSDTVVSLDGEILGKPSDEEEAFSMLSRLSGRTHQVYTGVAVLAGTERIEQQIVFFEKTDVDFYPVSEEEIRSYIASGEPMDKAGAYGIQGRGGRFVRRIRGDYNTVVGLPAARLYQELKTIR
jgi:septum formation protein